MNRLLQYVGMWGNWVVMYDCMEQELIALPLEAGFAPLKAERLSELGTKIEAAKRIKAANDEIGGVHNGY